MILHLIKGLGTPDRIPFFIFELILYYLLLLLYCIDHSIKHHVDYY